jgi:hypothetical protein
MDHLPPTSDAALPVGMPALDFQIQRMSHSLKRLNATAVTSEMLEGALSALAALPEAQYDDPARRVFCLLHLLRGRRGLTNVPVTALAIELRLLALERLHRESALPGCDWMPDGGAPKLTETVLRLAAEQPILRGGDGLAAFDARRFHAKLPS